MDCRDGDPIHTTQYTSRMETARMKEEVGADAIIVKE